MYLGQEPPNCFLRAKSNLVQQLPTTSVEKRGEYFGIVGRIDRIPRQCRTKCVLEPV